MSIHLYFLEIVEMQMIYSDGGGGSVEDREMRVESGKQVVFSDFFNPPPSVFCLPDHFH